MSHLMPPIHLIVPHYGYQKIEEQDKVTSALIKVMHSTSCIKVIEIKMGMQLVLGYVYLWIMHRLQVNNIVSATLIYPIVLINYAGTEVTIALFRDANSNTNSDYGIPDPDANAHPIHIKFTLMILSAQILLLSLVVWDDLFI